MPVFPLLRADTISTGGEFPQFTKGFMISGMQVVLVYLNFGKSEGITNSFKPPPKTVLKNIYLSVQNLVKKNIKAQSPYKNLVLWHIAQKLIP